MISSLFLTIPQGDQTRVVLKSLLKYVEPDTISIDDSDMVILSANSYSLNDHQFVRVELKLKEGEGMKKAIILLPRKQVDVIFEGAVPKEAVGFMLKR